MKKISKENFIDCFENIYPFFLATIVTLFYLLLDVEFKDSFEDILSASISFASIMLGFIGVLVALLFSLNRNKMKEYIFRDKHYKTRIRRYFTIPIETGFVFIMISLIMYLRQTLLGIEVLSMFIKYGIEVLSVVWIFTFIWFVVSSYRLMHIVLKIAFKGEQIEERIDILDEDAYREVQEKYAGASMKK